MINLRASVFWLFAMAVGFILGRSGTGKTSYCIKAVTDALLDPTDSSPLILLVPEQATYQAERAILSDERIAGYSRLKVLSFERLQNLLLGPAATGPTISPLGRQMIIHRILRENKAKLKVLGSSALLPGLAAQMAQTVVELHRYAKMPDDVKDLVGELQKNKKDNLPALKFADIGLVFNKYMEFIEAGFIDPDMQLSAACCRVANADLLKAAKLWVDGFAGFTASELAMLAQLLKASAESKIALCLDASKIDLKKPDTETLDPAGLFYSTEQTYADIIEIVKKCKLPHAEPIILKQPMRFSTSPDLAHVERNLFNAKPAGTLAADNIKIVSAANARAEIRFVAKQILRLVRQQNYRYRDIAVIASDIDSYQHYITAYLDDYEIPFFIDRKKSLSGHPAINLISSALQTAGSGFSHTAVFAYLKTGFVPIEAGDIDVLENYCLAFGIAGADWLSDKKWQFEDKENQRFDEKHINQIRFSTIKPLLKLRDELGDNLSKTISAEKFTRVIFDFLDTLQFRDTLENWINQAREKNDQARVDEHRQFYEKLVNVFDELAEVFAGCQMSAADLVAITDSAFSQMQLAFIPPTLDQVLVGSIERSRHPDLKAVFLIGATQKQFPVPVGYSGILTDDDRIAAESTDFQLAATSGQKLTERQYLAYIAFTRPRRFLCVTYPLADAKGSAVVRSQFVANLQSLFEDFNEGSLAADHADIENIANHSDLADILCSRCGKDAGPAQINNGSKLNKLLDDICADQQLAEPGSLAASAINYDNHAQLNSAIVEEFFSRQIKTSATKLGTFAACPYQYFARYTLNLEQRKEFKLEPLDIGNFYHRVLDAVLKQLNKTAKDFATAGDDQLLKIVRAKIDDFVTEDPFMSNFVRRGFHNAYIVRYGGEVLEACILAIARMARAGDFHPAFSEVWFGRKGQSIGEYKIAVSDTSLLSVSGIIDRVDIANIDGKKAAIIFDYKRKGKSFSWPQFYNGLDMQLPIYMLAVKNAAKSNLVVNHIAGAFYMPVEVGTSSADINKVKAESEKFPYKAKGIFNGQFAKHLDRQVNSGRSRFYNFGVSEKDAEYGWYNTSDALKPDDFENLLRFTEQKIIQLARQIISGAIDVRPYKLGTESPCGNCRYKSVCRVDPQINDYNLLESTGKKEVLKRIS